MKLFLSSTVSGIFYYNITNIICLTVSGKKLLSVESEMNTVAVAMAALPLLNIIAGTFPFFMEKELIQHSASTLLRAVEDFISSKDCDKGCERTVDVVRKIIKL